METLFDGVNHIALLTRDMDRCMRFDQEVFAAHVVHDNRHHAGHAGERMVMLALGGQSAFHVFEVPGTTQAQMQTPMFGRGRLDHCGLNARSRETFEHARTRRMHVGASDGTMTDFGSALSVFFRDPDGVEADVGWITDPQTLAAGSRTTESRVPAMGTVRSPEGTVVTSQ
jgi:catechol 2,3-dioxygenase-like lactoylglutathione lyase family enzyme